MSKNARLLLSAIIGLAGWLTTGSTPVIAAQDRTELASSDRDGHAVGSSSFGPTSLDRSGRFVLFQSDANGVVPGDVDGDRDLFRKDLATGKVDWISVGVVGHASNGDMSGDGRFVVFYAGRTYLRDLDRRTTTVVDGRIPYPVDAPAVSDDGTKVAFAESSTLHVADLTRGTVADIPVGKGSFVDLTPDGKWLVFEEDDGTTARIIRLDLHTEDRVVIDEVPSGPGAGPVFPFVSDDGSVVAYTVFTNGFSDLDGFVWEGGAVQPISGAPVSAAGGLSAAGQHVLVVEAASVAVATAALGILDRTTGDTTPIGETVDAWAMALTHDGRTVAWTTTDSLAPGDDNGVADVYVTRPGWPPHGRGQRPVATPGRSAFSWVFAS